MKRLLLINLFVLLPSFAFAQLAVETQPGLTFYGDGTVGVETLPGLRYFSGPVEGTAVQIAPGMTYYNLRPNYEDGARARAEEQNRSDWEFMQSTIRSRQEQQRRDDAFWDRIRNGK